MLVKLIAQTMFNTWDVSQVTPYVDHYTMMERSPEYTALENDWAAQDEYFEAHGNVSDLDELAEFAGRNCYEAWERKNPETATNKGYLGNIIAQGHFSVLEHSSATFYVRGVSRSLLAELSRHRHLSLSVVSQRYVDHGCWSTRNEPVVPQLFDDDLAADLLDHYERSQVEYDTVVSKLIAKGASRKEARGAARAFLPEATETAIVMTGNMRTWREILMKRNSPAADVEIRELAKELLTQLKELAPNTFQDLIVDENN